MSATPFGGCVDSDCSGVVQDSVMTSSQADSLCTGSRNADSWKAGSWKAELRLGFEFSHGATRMVESHHRGPLRVQRPFYPEGQHASHIYLLHPPGGMVSGDDLQMQFHAGADTHVLLTTPSAGKVYRVGESRNLQQRQTVSITAAKGAVVEWLPQENIVFSGADTVLRNRVELDADATFIGWETLCLGRPAGNHPFVSGNVSQSFEVFRAGKPLYIERGQFKAGSPMMSQYWGLQGQPVVGTLVCAWPNQPGDQRYLNPAARELLLTELRETLSGYPGVSLGASPGGKRTSDALLAATDLETAIVVRYLGVCTEQARELFVQAWSFLRPRIVGVQARQPRIWAT